MIDKIIEFNRQFVANKEYEKFASSKYPDKKLAVLSCMDTRLTELLPAAMGLKNGDAKFIKNAGAVLTHPFGSVVRSLLVAIVELGVTDVMVVGHTDCGVQHLDGDEVVARLKERGISQRDIDTIKLCGVDFRKWLCGFDTVEQSVAESVTMLRNHPLIPKDIRINGFVINTVTGELVAVE